MEGKICCSAQSRSSSEWMCWFRATFPKRCAACPDQKAGPGSADGKQKTIQFCSERRVKIAPIRTEEISRLVSSRRSTLAAPGPTKTARSDPKRNCDGCSSASVHNSVQASVLEVQVFPSFKMNEAIIGRFALARFTHFGSGHLARRSGSFETPYIRASSELLSRRRNGDLALAVMQGQSAGAHARSSISCRI